MRLVVVALACGWSGIAAQAADTAALQNAFRDRVQPQLVKYCFDCHSGDATEGGMNLDRFKSLRQVQASHDVWLKVLGKLRVKAMPPEDAPQLSDADRNSLLQWVDEALHSIDCVHDAEPGHVTIRRLNRVEYRNTVRDLLGVDYEPAADFPADDVGYGFDNIGDVLSLPPILLEKYLDAAAEIADRAIVTQGLGLPVVLEKHGSELIGAGSDYDGDSRILTSSGDAKAEIDVKQTADYEIIVTAFGHQAGDEKAKLGLRFDDREVQIFDVPATEDKPGEYRATGRAKQGKHEIAIAFLNDYYKPDAPDRNNRDRNLIITRLEVRGPLDAKPNVPDSHRRIFFVEPSDKVSDEEAARKILERLASRAYRRPAAAAELDRLLKLVKMSRQADDSFHESIQFALQAILVSPYFLFRVEAEPPTGATERDLSDYELATRLSYFLWSSMPDDELLSLAWRGLLRKDGNLERQVQRMLQHPKSQALVDNFAAQWLELRKFDELAPSQKHFPGFNEQLRQDMRRETELFFADVLRNDRSVIELLVADYTFLNERLARHYGIPEVKGDEFRKVSLTGTPRGGLLTHGSVLTVTSNPTRTSPVKRGRWILENLLGEPPPPPPPNVPELVSDGQELTGTLRQRMEQHRANPNCAICHEQMDALGFALENFDAVGAWRLFDGKYPIDPTGELPGGVKFRGSAELARVLRDRKASQFVRCMSEKLLTYALGRGLEFYDQCAVDTIMKTLDENDHRFSVLVLEIVKSEPFQKQGIKRSVE